MSTSATLEQAAPSRHRVRGTRPLLRLALRRDRLMIPIWVYALVAAAVGTGYSFKALYGSTAEQEQLAAGVNANSSILALVGRLHEPLSVAGLTSWRLLGLGAVLTSVMSILLVVRHTRAEEEEGRLELLAAGSVGRFAPLAAALSVMALANVTVAVLMASGLVLIGFPTIGSIAFGLGWCTVGIGFGGLAAVTAQIAGTARSANGMAMAALGAAFLLRAAGDAGTATWLSYLSPIGWAQRLRPYTDENWWPLLPLLGFAAVTMLVAVRLNDRRDLGGAMLAARPGPVDSTGLTGVRALAWRLQRAGLLGWGVAILIWGLVIGNLAGDVGKLLGSSTQLQELMAELGGPGALADSFIAATAGILGLIVAAFAVQTLLRLRAEETSGRAELLLSGSVGRIPWLLATVWPAVRGSALLLAVGGLGTGGAYALRSGDAGQIGRVLGATLVQLPAVLVVIGAGVLVLGLLPRWAAAIWGLLGVFLLLGQLGPALQLPGWAIRISPFGSLPKLPGEALAWGPVVALVLVALVLGGIGAAAFRHRDLG
ncbi:ABC transporter permease [Nakamurella silvestris]|nr:ABC transporter permease [Nakamurella silvestris]